MPGVRTLSWPWMFSLWELHRVVGIRTWEGEHIRTSVTEAEKACGSSGQTLILGMELGPGRVEFLSDVAAEQGWGGDQYQDWGWGYAWDQS